MAADETRALQDKFMLRLPEGLRERIRRAADSSNRSMNSEIIATLEEKYPAPLSSDDWRGILDALPRLDLDSLPETERADIAKKYAKHFYRLIAQVAAAQAGEPKSQG